MGEQLNYGRENIVLSSPLQALWNPRCQIPCLIVFPETLTISDFETILNPLREVLSERGFHVKEISEGSILEGQVDENVLNSALCILLLKGKEPGLQYSYGYLKAKGKFVLTVRDLDGETQGPDGNDTEEPGSSQVNQKVGALSEILIDSRSQSSTPETISTKLKEQVETIIKSVLDNYVKELTAGYSTLDPKLFSELRELISEVLNYYTKTQNYSLNDLNRLLEALRGSEKKSGRKLSFLFFTIFSELFRELSETEEARTIIDELLTKAAGLLEELSFEDRSEELVHCVKVKRGEFLCLISTSEGLKERHERAIELFNGAIKYFSNRQRDDICAYLNRLVGDSLLQLALVQDQDDKKVQMLKESLSHIESSAQFYSPYDFELENSYLIKLRNRVLRVILESDNSGEYLDFVIERLNESQRFISPKSYPELFSDSQIYLGNAYSKRAEINSSAEDCILSIEAYERAQEVSKALSSVEISAAVLNNLGLSHNMLAELDESEESGFSAVQCFEGALSFYTFNKHPLEYAEAQNNMGNAYCTLAELSGLEPNSEKAASCFLEALKVWTLEAQPYEYGKTQNNLGVTYSALSEIKDKEENLESALGAFTEALKVYDLSDYPKERAMILSNLGDAYSLISGLKDKSLNLKEAQAAYEQALTVYTEADSPINNALLQNKLGDVLFELSELGEGAEYAGRSLSSYESSIQYYSKEEHPVEFAGLMTKCGRVLMSFALRDKETEVFEKANEAYQAALSVFNKEEYPEEYLELKLLRGDAYRGFSEILTDINLRSQSFESALIEYNGALSVSENLASEEITAEIYNKIGVCHAGISALSDSDEQSEKALNAFSRAIEALGTEYEPSIYGVLKNNLGALYCRAEIVSGDYKNLGAQALQDAASVLKYNFAQSDTEAPLYAKTLGNLGAIYNKSACTENPEVSLYKSIEVLNQALSKINSERAPREYARILNNLGNSHFMLGAFKDGKENYSLAVDSYNEALGIYSENHSIEYLICANNLGKAYLAISEQGEEVKSIENALKSFKAALSVAEDLDKSLRRAEIITNIALAYCKLAIHKGGAQNYASAAASFEEALKVYTSDSYPVRYSEIKKNIALVLMLSCEFEENNEGYVSLSEKALEYFEEACLGDDAERSSEYGYVRAAMGDAHMFISSVEDKQYHENSAEECYFDALKCFPVDSFPEHYLQLIQRLEPIYYESDKDPGRIIEFCSEALKAYQFDTNPYEYAATNKKLALAHRSLRGVENDDRGRQDELFSLEQALRGYTVMGEKQECGLLQRELGDIHMELAQKANSPDEYRAAITHYDEALKVFTAGEQPELYGEIKKCLGTAYGALAGAQEGDENYLREIDSYNKALGVFTRDEYFDEYRELKKRMGGVYSMLAGAKAELGDYKGALEQYEEALKVFTYEDFPEEYGKYKYELGKMLGDSGRSSEDFNLIEKALFAYRDSTRFYNESERPEEYSKIGDDIKGLYKFLGEFDAGSGASAQEIYGKLLKTCTESEAPYEYALLQMKLGDSYLGAPEPGSTVPDASASKHEDLNNSIDSYQKALSVYDGPEFQKERACINFRLGLVYRSLAKFAIEKENLVKSADSFNSSVGFYTNEEYPQANTKAGYEIREIYKRLSELESEGGDLKEALNYLEKALEMGSWEESSEEAAAVRKQIGDMYTELAEGVDRAFMLKKASSYYEDALEYFISETHPEDFGLLTKALADIYFETAGGINEAENYKKSLYFAEFALSYFTPENNQVVYAELQEKIGDICGALFSADQDIELLKKRVTSLSESHRACCCEVGEIDRSDISTKLASAYRDLGDALNDTGDQKDAATNYSLSLELYENNDPPAGASLCFELGTIYENLSKTEEILENAGIALGYYNKAKDLFNNVGEEVKAKESEEKFGAVYKLLGEYACGDGANPRAAEELNAILAICTKESAPEQFARIKRTLGNYYRDLLRERGNTEAKDMAFTAYREAEEVLGSLGYESEVKGILAEKASLISIISDKKLEECEFDGALEGFRQALDIYDSLELGQEYADTERRIGAVYIKRGESFEDAGRGTSDDEALKNAVAEYTDALGICSVTESPAQFGALHMKLSSIYLLMGEREGSIEHYNKTIGACREALRVFGPEDYPEKHMEIQNNIVSAYEAITELKDRQTEEEKTKEQENVIQLSDEKPILQVVKTESQKDVDDEVLSAEPERDEAEQVPQAVMAKASSGDSGVGAYYDEPEFQDSSQAIDYYTKALSTTTIESSPEQYGFIKSRLGGLYTEVARTTGSASGFRRAVKSYEDSLEVFSPDEYPEKYGEVQKRIGESMMLLAEQSGDHKSYRRALIAYNDALNVFHMEDHPGAFGKLQMNIGKTYVTLAEMSGNADEYRNAISAYEKALLVFNAKEHSQQYGEANRNTGVAYGILAEIDGNTEYHKNAIQAFVEALRFYSAENAPTEYGEISKYLGMAYGNTAAESGDAKTHKLAVESYKEALGYYTEEQSLNDYGLIQKNLGSAYEKLSAADSSSENAEFAIEAFGEALKFYKSGNMPLDYASIQSSLGGLYKAVSENSDKVRNLKKAIKSYEEVLKVFDIKEYPIEYAATENNLGIVYRSLAEAEDKGKNCKRAVNSYKEALKIYSRSSYPDQYGSTQTNLGSAYRTLAEVEEKEVNCKHAVRAFEEALKVRTIKEHPLQFAATQNNLGVVYRSLGEKEDRGRNSKKAIDAYETALIIYAIDKYPIQYASTQNNIGAAYTTLAEVENKEENCDKAINAYTEALKIFTKERFPGPNKLVTTNLELLKKFCGRDCQDS